MISTKTHELHGFFIHQGQTIEWFATQDAEYDDPTEWTTDHIQIDGDESPELKTLALKEIERIEREKYLADKAITDKIMEPFRAKYQDWKQIKNKEYVHS